jgi:23S rRNA (guanine745-N1)-methyltransferase
VLDHVLELLRCPHCSSGLARQGAVVGCEEGHGFDVARQGYVNLLAGGTGVGTADSPEMIAARASFLDAGHYEPIAEALTAACSAMSDVSRVADVGAGTGRYLARVLDGRPDAVGVALDVSKHALRRCARAHPRIGAVGCDVWEGLPIRQGVLDVALSAFSPRNPAELARVLRVDGRLVIVAPTPRHLQQLVRRVGLVTVDQRKRERLATKLGSRFLAVEESELDWTMQLDRQAVRDLVGMGPSARHIDEATLTRRVDELPEPFAVDASVTVTAYELRP